MRRMTGGDVLFGFVPAGHCRVVLDRTARLEFRGRLVLGEKENRRSTLETRLSMGRASLLAVNGRFSVGSGSDIRVFPQASLTLDGGYCTMGVQIVCFERISVGRGCALARDVIIRDGDGHAIANSGKPMTGPVRIGAHVWIGSRAMVMKGVTVGDGAIVAAGAIVTVDVPDRCLVGGIPARVLRRDVEWS